MATKQKTVKVVSQYFAGKTVNVPHTEHRVADDVDGQEKNAVTFGEDGSVKVSPTLAAALVEFYPRLVSVG
jgi:hypothetical protein